MNKNTSNNNGNINKNDMIIIMIKQRNIKPKDTNNKYY